MFMISNRLDYRTVGTIASLRTLWGQRGWEQMTDYAVDGGREQPEQVVH
jgi:hypothetical protein